MKEKLFAALLLVMPTQVCAGILDGLLCTEDITQQIRGQYEAIGRFSGSSIDIEITNNSKDLSITSVSVRLEGTYRNRNFKRVYEKWAVEAEPGRGARLLISTEFSYNDAVDVDKLRVYKLYGC